jgi:hypothetical protein
MRGSVHSNGSRSTFPRNTIVGSSNQGPNGSSRLSEIKKNSKDVSRDGAKTPKQVNIIM